MVRLDLARSGLVPADGSALVARHAAAARVRRSCASGWRAWPGRPRHERARDHRRLPLRSLSRDRRRPLRDAGRAAAGIGRRRPRVVGSLRSPLRPLHRRRSRSRVRPLRPRRRAVRPAALPRRIARRRRRRRPRPRCRRGGSSRGARPRARRHRSRPARPRSSVMPSRRISSSSNASRVDARTRPSASRCCSGAAPRC